MNFNATRAEHDTIIAICKRAEDIAADRFRLEPRHARMMDLEACHSNGCPLDLEALLAAPAVDFAHDVFGITRHIDRETGRLGGCFLPRFAARKSDPLAQDIRNLG